MNIFLRRARFQAQLTQEELASALGTTTVSIWRWERGSKPSPFFRAAICAYFHVSPDEFGWPSPPDHQKRAGSQERGSSFPFLLDPAIPLLPDSFIGQHRFLDQLEKLLCVANGPQRVGLVGLVGSGKTAVVQQLSTASDIHKAFASVLWASIGQKARPLHHLQRWAQLLGLDSLPPSLSDAQDRLRTAIGRRPLLFVLDDVWTPADFSPLQVGGPACRYVLTTRQPGLARLLSQQVMPVQKLADDEALALLMADFPKAAVCEHTRDLYTLIRKVGKLPLALILMREYLRQQAHQQAPRRLREAIARLISQGGRVAGPDILQMETPWYSCSLAAAILQSEAKLSSPGQATFRLLAQHFQDRTFTESEAAALVEHRRLHRELDDLMDTGLLGWSEPGFYQFHPILAEYAHRFPAANYQQGHDLLDPWLLPQLAAGWNRPSLN